MTYTFDDAIKQWNRESANGPLVRGIVASPLRNVPQQEYDRVKFMNRLFYSIIERLREEYKPTVEMTKEQHDTFVRNTDFQKAQTKMDLGFGELTLLQYAYIAMNPDTVEVVDE